MSQLFLPPRARRGRIVFDTFRSTGDPRLRAWLLFRAALVPELEAAPLAAQVAEDSVPDGLGVYGVWRLLASNNRELARCALVHPSPRAALRAVRVEQARIGETAVVSVRGPRATTHSWVLRRRDHPVITAPRWYESASEAVAASRAAIAAFAAADVVDSVSIGTASGRRSTLSVGHR